MNRLSVRLLFVSVCLCLLASVGVPTRAQETKAPPSSTDNSVPFDPVRAGLIVDPLRSNTMGLLFRADVQAALALTPEQRAALEGVRRQRLAEARQAMGMNSRDAAGMKPEERLALIRERVIHIIYLPTEPAELDKRAEALLQPNQVKRLQELDLQRRGPLALATPALADSFQLTPEQRDRLEVSQKLFRVKVDIAAAAGYAAWHPFPLRSPGDQPVRTGKGKYPLRRLPRPLPTGAQLDENLKKACKAADRVRKEAGEKAAASLTPAQRQHWQQMTGAPFVFKETPEPEPKEPIGGEGTSS